jgi:hypothetical protein
VRLRAETRLRIIDHFPLLLKGIRLSSLSRLSLRAHRLGGDIKTNVPVVDMPLTGLGNTPFYHPFENSSVYQLVNWFYCASQAKSVADLNTLVHDVILAKDFNLERFQNFSTA